MADKISQLPPAISVALTDEFALNQSGVTRRANTSQLATGVQSNIDHTAIQNIGTISHVAIDTHIANLINPHVVTKDQVSLGNVENTKINLVATTPPTVNDDNTVGYSVLSRWADVTNDNEYVCIDASTGAAIWTATTSVAKGIVQFTPAGNTSTARAPYPSKASGSTAQTYFPLVIPSNFTSVDSVKLYGIASATASGLDIDSLINYSDPISEVYNANSASDTSSTYATIIDGYLIIDVTSIFSGVSAGDVVGINVNHNGIGQTIYYVKGELIYNRF